MALIELQGVEKIYNPRSRAAVHALRGLDARIEQGEMVAIQGPSGSGKSTLLHVIGCVETLTGGRYTFDGKPMERLSDRQRARRRNETFGFVLQHFGLIQERRVWENVALPLMLGRGGKDVKAKSLSMLERVGLKDLANRRAAELSGGEQQRVAIARAVIHAPRVILADEPTGNLDSETAASIMALLRELHGEGRTLLIVTHDDGVARQCGRVLRIRDGRLETQ